MKLRYLTLASCLFFIGCDFDLPEIEEAVLTLHIERGGAGSVREDLLKITPSKEGVEGERQIADFIEAWGTRATEEEGVLESGAGYDAEGVLNAFATREVGDIFQVVQELSGSSRFRLRMDEAFSLSWDGEVLSVTHEFLNPEAYDDLDELSFKIVITTDGRFLEAGPGELNASRTELVITKEDVMMDHRLHFEITDLAD